MLKKIFFAVFVIAFSILPDASAYTLSQSQSFYGTQNISGTFTFEQFDTNGGYYTLQSVAISFVLQSSSGSVVLDNDSETAVSGTFEFGNKGGISSADVSLLNSTSTAIASDIDAFATVPFYLAENNGDGAEYDSTSPDGLFYNGTIVNNWQTDYVASVFWNDGNNGFIGGGDYDIQYCVNSRFDYSSSGQIDYTYIPADIMGFVTVQYTYCQTTNVPEPATIGLLSAGLLAMARKRKNNSKK